MDSELQIALIGAGLAAVVLIVGYNKWQERKHRRDAEKAFKSDHRDVLLEPRAGEDPPLQRREPGFGDSEPSGDGPRPFRETQVKRSVPEAPQMLDPRADCIVRIEAIEALDAQQVWLAQAAQLTGLSKPVRWFGFNDGDNLWHPLGPHTAGAFHWFCAGLQLVDRNGSIGETDFMRFSGGVQRVADAVMALPPGVPARAEILSNAAELDRFCADVDVQIGVNVVATKSQFDGVDIARQAERHGLALSDDGSFHARDADGSTLFTVGNVEAGLFAAGAMSGLVTQGLTLVIDVPRVANGVAAFDRLMRTATDLAEALGGQVVDDNRVPFGNDAASLIRTQIQQFQTRMAEHNMPAGGSLANRLFSA